MVTNRKSTRFSCAPLTIEPGGEGGASVVRIKIKNITQSLCDGDGVPADVTWTFLPAVKTENQALLSRLPFDVPFIHPPRIHADRSQTRKRLGGKLGAVWTINEKSASVRGSNGEERETNGKATFAGWSGGGPVVGKTRRVGGGRPKKNVIP